MAVDKEKLKKEMSEDGKLGVNYKRTLKQIHDDSQKEISEIFDIFSEAFNHEEVIDAFGDDWDRRADYAVRVVKARIADEVATPTETIELLILGREIPQERESRDGEGTYVVGRIRGLGVSDNDDSLKKITVQGYDDQAHYVEEVKYKKSYKMNVEKRSQSKDEATYQFLSKTEIEETDYEPDNPEKMLSKLFKKIDISEASQYVSAGDGSRPQEVMIRANIQNFRDLQGNGLTIYDVYDDSMSLQQIENDASLFGVTIPTTMAKWGRDAEVLFIGSITDHDEYGLGMWVNYAWPIIPREREQPQQAEEQEVTADDAQEFAEDMADAEVDMEDEEFDDFM